MIKLHQFQPIWGLPNASPFCMKLETYLKMAKIPYETIFVNTPAKGPKAKLPFIEDDGKKLGDSALIIDYLKKKYGDPLDKDLTSQQKAIALSVQHLLEDHLYWVLVYSRWAEPSTWESIKKSFFSNLPPVLRNIVPEMVRKKFLKKLYLQGIAHHTRDEIYEFGKRDITAIADLLGDQSFFFGKQPTSIDATLYAFLSSVLLVPFESLLKSHAQNYAPLEKYCARMKELYYS